MDNNIDFKITPNVISRLDNDRLRFIYEVGQKKLENTYQQGDIMYNRSLTIASVIIASISAIIGYLLTTVNSIEVLVASFVTMALLVYTLVTIKPNLLPIKYNSTGCEPKFLVEDYIYDQEIDGKDDEWKLLYNRVVNCQHEIEINIKNNKDRADNLKDAIYAIFGIPVILIITLLISLCHLL